MKRRFTLQTLLLVFLFTPFAIHSQIFTGYVVNEDGDPIEDAYIIHLSTDHHAHTNSRGQFQLGDLEVNDSIQIIHISYVDQIYKITDLSGDLVISMQADYFDLGTVVIGETTKRTNYLSYIDSKTTSVNNSQEVLRKVPGLFIGQHAGGGKAEQIFLRGFDIDHGTDINLTVDGMPVNMVSHAHGQGYADLHFVIPETIELIDFGKGPYYEDQGNFTTAGYVAFKTKDELESSFLKAEFGQFNTFRTAGMFSLVNEDKHDAYIASEFIATDGPFESSQNFSRLNLFAKYTGRLSSDDKISLTASHFQSEWDASGQIPVRAVENGSITRFGAIDDTEGGYTRRTNVNFQYEKTLSSGAFLRNRVFYSEYDFELFSNFTFFLEDPVNGDQIRQFEDRQLFGVESVYNSQSSFDFANTLFRAGVGYRNDISKDNQLARTANRKTTLEQIRLGDINEKNIYTFASYELDFDKLSIQGALRWDYFNFNYISQLAPTFDRLAQSNSVLSPKLNFIYNLNNSVQLYLKSGVGFHSNDTRVILEQNVEDALPRAYGSDLGVSFKPLRNIFVDVAFWYLFLEQEFVYVGDAGIVEPSGRTGRRGIDLGLRYQISDKLFLSSDFNYTYARSLDDPEGDNLIPLAPISTHVAGLNYKGKKFSASYNHRYLMDRPANEDNSIVANGYFISDVNASYKVGKVNFGISIENLFNSDWEEAQFATESRLRNETDSFEEIHFTPGTPFFAKGIVTFTF